MPLDIRPADKVRWDHASLGEVMLRLDPGDMRVHTARTFTAWEGGGEYNVSRGLRRCFGLRTTHVTALVDNAVGRLVEDLMLQGGVDLSYLKWVKDDGIGRKSRNGLNFTERGFGVRAALGCVDRGHTAVSQMDPEDVDWEKLFGQDGVRWLHCGGIFAALSAKTPLVAKKALETAKKHGTIVSWDLNYRPSLWADIGGQAKAQEGNKSLAPLIDVMIGNEEDFTACLGLEVKGVDLNATSKLDPSHFKDMIKEAVKIYPNFKVVATTLRNATTATFNDWAAICYYDGEFYHSKVRNDLQILDRVGGGDSFASGLVYGFLSGKGAQYAVDCGAAHGALAMTTPGDTSMVRQSEVEKVMGGGSARVAR